MNWKGSEEIPDFILAELTGNAKPDIVGEIIMDFVFGGGFATGGIKGIKAVSTLSKSSKVRHSSLSKGTAEIGWSMPRGGGVINGRQYSQHALERMAPDIPEVKATLTSRAIKNEKDTW